MVLLDQGPQVRGVLRTITLDRVVEGREDVVTLDRDECIAVLCARETSRYGVTVMFLLG
jgi:hypothetical protein